MSSIFPELLVRLGDRQKNVATVGIPDERLLVARERFLPFLAYEIEISEIENGRQIVPEPQGRL